MYKIVKHVGYLELVHYRQIRKRDNIIASFEKYEWHDFFSWCNDVKGVYALRQTEEEFKKLLKEWQSIPKSWEE